MQEIVVLAEAARGADAHLTVMHAAVPDEAAALAADLKTARSACNDVLIMDLVPADRHPRRAGRAWPSASSRHPTRTK